MRSGRRRGSGRVIGSAASSGMPNTWAGLFGIGQNAYGFELSVCAASGPLPNDFFVSVGG